MLCCASERWFAELTADSDVIWLATMPIDSRIPTAPARPSLFPMLLNLIIAASLLRSWIPGFRPTLEFAIAKRSQRLTAPATTYRCRQWEWLICRAVEIRAVVLRDGNFRFATHPA